MKAGASGESASATDNGVVLTDVPGMSVADGLDRSPDGDALVLTSVEHCEESFGLTPSSLFWSERHLFPLGRVSGWGGGRSDVAEALSLVGGTLRRVRGDVAVLFRG